MFRQMIEKPDKRGQRVAHDSPRMRQKRTQPRVGQIGAFGVPQYPWPPQSRRIKKLCCGFILPGGKLLAKLLVRRYGGWRTSTHTRSLGAIGTSA